MIDEYGVEQVTFEELEHRAVEAQNKAIEQKKRIQATFATIASAALDALASRAVVIYSLSLVAGAFAWALYDPTIIRTATATIFAGVLIFAGLFKAQGGSNG